ncbi:hypothetical protein E2C01_025706 [Portunus trituberculatus]|uniref:Uncharacterized protein n=1 Tax=Portunus trituberculatus TaxID=210409 RepID=A0A5B7EGG0_PORTR|nr:hypothetical protein [Portunus trituberculatus]
MKTYRRVPSSRLPTPPISHSSRYPPDVTVSRGRKRLPDGAKQNDKRLIRHVDVVALKNKRRPVFSDPLNSEERVAAAAAAVVVTMAASQHKRGEEGAGAGQPRRLLVFIVVGPRHKHRRRAAQLYIHTSRYLFLDGGLGGGRITGTSDSKAWGGQGPRRGAARGESERAECVSYRREKNMMSGQPPAAAFQPAPRGSHTPPRPYKHSPACTYDA